MSFQKAAASIAVAIVSAYLAFQYRNRLKETRKDLQNLIAQNQRMAQDYNHSIPTVNGFSHPVPPADQRRRGLSVRLTEKNVLLAAM